MFTHESGIPGIPHEGRSAPTRGSGAVQNREVTMRYRRSTTAVAVRGMAVFGLAREIRTVDLARGLASLEFGDVAAKIQTETVHIRALR